MIRIASPFTAALVAALALAPTATAGPRLSEAERQIVRHLNDVRAQHGLAALRPSRRLSRGADRHSRDMLRRDFFDHRSSDGTTFARRVRRYAQGAAVLGETLAMLGQRRGGGATIVQMWMDSPPHRAIVLTAGFRRVGIGRRWGRLGDAPFAVVTADFAS